MKPYKILLIEPDVKLGNTIAEWLDETARVTQVSDLRQAEKQALSKNWDLVITDINSNEINDLHITELVKKSNPFVGILIIAKDIKIDFIISALKFHADDLLFKPLNKDIFVPRVLQLAEEFRVKKNQNKGVILAIGAHPDDVEYGCGGTLARLHAEGCDLNILTLSPGSIGGNPQIRIQESRKAAKGLNARLIMGEFFDTCIHNGIETIQFIESIVKELRPTHVYTHSMHDNHQDHRSVFQATVIATRKTPNVFSYCSPSCNLDYKPNIFVNIDKYIDDKLEAIAAFTSQIEIRPYLQPDMIMASARYWGRFNNYTLVEPMEIIKKAE